MKRSFRKRKNLQKATLKIKQKYGKNAILKGMNLEEGATTRERNEIIGDIKRNGYNKNIHDYSDIINLPYKNLKSINICLKRSCSTVCSFCCSYRT